MVVALRFLRTLIHLKPRQIFYQVIYRVWHPFYVLSKAPAAISANFRTSPIAKRNCLEGEVFTFLNLNHKFIGWEFAENGMLWAYNQNYFDWINQTGFSMEEGCEWIDRFIADFPDHLIGLDPYPIALRCINWVKFFSRNQGAASNARRDALYSQLLLLNKKLEFHLLGNHLLEDAFALYIGAAFLNDSLMQKKATNLLLGQLKEQILCDGAHYEQSPMYHCILLDRLLDCINIHTTPKLEQYAVKMLGHLESIIWKDESIPLLNDSSYGIAPTPGQLFDYAKRLGLQWKAIPMKESGYRKMTAGKYEAIVDVGNITATNQPGHSHADSLNYELRIDGNPVVVDCGISTYNKTERRQYERGTTAHNCVSPNGKDSSEVWGGFRVGRRCHTEISESTGNRVVASHNGFDAICRRRFEISDVGFCIEDWYDNEAISYVHLAEGTDGKRVIIDDALSVEVKPWKYSVEYNRFIEGKVIEIRFKGHCKYTIQ